MNSKIAIIEGSARSNGDTRMLTNYLRQDQSNWDLFDLNQLNIGPYDYQQRNQDDDFLTTAQRLLEYPTLILATPIYWYTVSGAMKDFMDRISDLLVDPHKDIGRALRGKRMASLSCSRGEDLVAGFEMPLRETANYLGMDYLGHYHGWVQDDRIAPKAVTVMDQLKKSVSE